MVDCEEYLEKAKEYEHWASVCKNLYSTYSNEQHYGALSHIFNGVNTGIGKNVSGWTGKKRESFNGVYQNLKVDQAKLTSKYTYVLEILAKEALQLEERAQSLRSAYKQCVMAQDEKGN
ncbi:hypothetical protein [Priestia endophytica]|uniref:hypothetical protein n=1 Tax=Priestia endophytica TaxID=135735 RepID=UPI002E1F892A|nr:hypothetical protein [Priestia endophytica]